MQDDSSRLPVNTNVLIRFFEKIRIDRAITYKGSPCWLWTRQLNKGGYGIFSYKTAGIKYREAYRIAYSMFVELAPVGKHDLTLDHLCRVRSCVNPAHLEKVPERINILRGENFAAKHARKTHCPQGHEFTTENTYPIPRASDGKIIGRGCRKCRKYDPAKRREPMRLWAQRRRIKLREQANHKDKGANAEPTPKAVEKGEGVWVT